MFEFTDKFDTLENDKLILKITQKYIGDNEMIPFYYYDIIRKTDSVTVGKISIRIGSNFHSYYNGHIGYEIFKEYRGNGYAYRASLMVLDVARFHDMEFIYLTTHGCQNVINEFTKNSKQVLICKKIIEKLE